MLKPLADAEVVSPFNEQLVDNSGKVQYNNTIATHITEVL